jgi:hypothetical protein
MVAGPAARERSLEGMAGDERDALERERDYYRRLWCLERGYTLEQARRLYERRHDLAGLAMRADVNRAAAAERVERLERR